MRRRSNEPSTYLKLVISHHISTCGHSLEIMDDMPPWMGKNDDYTYTQFQRDPMGVQLEALLWTPKADFAISEQGAQKCVCLQGR